MSSQVELTRLWTVYDQADGKYAHSNNGAEVEGLNNRPPERLGGIGLAYAYTGHGDHSVGVV